MRIRIILIYLMAVLTFASCGIQRTVAPSLGDGPFVQNTFYGAKLGDSAYRVNRQWSRYRPSINRQTDIVTLTFADSVFGGSSWDNVQGVIVAGFLSWVSFFEECKYEIDALDRMETVCRMLRQKYGDLKPMKEGVGYFFTDSYENTVTVQVKPQTDSKGNDYWACYLIYYWGPGKELVYLKSLSDI